MVLTSVISGKAAEGLIKTMKSFQIEILTPQKAVYSGKADALVLNGARGYFGVLVGHAPLIARLAPGILTLTRDGKEFVYQAGTGFVQVGRERVSILLDKIIESSGS